MTTYSCHKSTWDDFYKHNGAPDSPSSFAFWSERNFHRDSVIFELGCGNGRDASYFARQGHKTIACDASKEAVLAIREKYAALNNLEILHHDFSTLTPSWREKGISVVYSRFTLHAVKKGVATQSLKWASDVLAPKGRVFIEARSVKSDLYGQGQNVGPDEFIYGHYRRFLRIDELTEELRGLGFSIENKFEGSGVAVYKDDDPVVVRVVARKD